MGKIPSKNINISHSDRQIIFRSTGESELHVGEGTPASATGSTQAGTAAVHGTVPGSSVNIQNPA